MQEPHSVIVIGAGVIGVALAAELHERGVAVTVIDAQAPGSGTTGTSYAWINSHKKHPLDYHELNMRGVAAWRAIAEADPTAVSFSGHVEIAESEAHRENLTARVERLQSLGYSAVWLTEEEARASVTAIVPEGALVASFPSEGHAFPVRWVTDTVERLKTAGVGFVTDRVTAVHEQADGATVALARGASERADLVVIAAGNGADALASSAGGSLPLVPAVLDSAAFGYLSIVEAPGHGMTQIVTTDSIGMRPTEDGHLLVQTLDLDATACPGVPVPDAVVETIERRVAATLPHTTPLVRSVCAGHRVIPADGRTAAGPLREGSRVWAIVTHSGVVLAPWLGAVIAAEMCGGEPEPLLADFRPSRFLTEEPLAAQPAPRAPGDQ